MHTLLFFKYYVFVASEWEGRVGKYFPRGHALQKNIGRTVHKTFWKSFSQTIMQNFQKIFLNLRKTSQFTLNVLEQILTIMQNMLNKF